PSTPTHVSYPSQARHPIVQHSFPTRRSSDLKPYGEFNTFTVKDIEVRIKNEYDELISRIIKDENMEIIKDLLEKKESNFVHLLADMYVATYRIQHELNNTQRMINDRNDELNKLLDLYDKTMNLVVHKMNEDEY